MKGIGSEQQLDLIFLKKALKKRPLPENLFLSLNDRCDLNCAHCRYRSRKRRDVMSFGKAKNALKQAAENRIPQVTFFGGEPSLYPRLTELVKYAASLSIFTELDTNGQSLTLQGLKKLSSAGLSCVMVSIHSEKAAEHDRLTGKTGSYLKSLEFIKNSLKAGLICYISACFFKKDYSGERLKKFAVFSKNLGAHGIRSLFFCGKNADTAYPPRIAADIKTLRLGNYMRGCFSPDPKNKICAGELGKVLYIGAGGEARMCPYSKQVLGNIGKKSLSEIIKLAKEPPDTPSLPCAF